jgi:hypothetical protein
MLDRTDRPRTAAAVRQRKAADQRRWRERDKNGIRIYGVPLGNADLNKLIDIGLLGADESANKADVVKAVLDALADYFKARAARLSP